MKLGVAIVFWCAIWLVVSFGICTGVYVYYWKTSVDTLWLQSAAQTTQNVQMAIDTHLDAVEFAAQFVPLGDTVLANRLLHYFAHHDQYSGYSYSSMGTLTLAGNTTAGKWSWQVAKYPPSCPVEPTYGYFYADASIYPAFHGYCAFQNASTIDWSIQTYSGYDWGLYVPTEAELVVDATIDQSYKPIFDLLGNPTLTFEVYRPLDAGMPASRGRYVTFAELQLSTLSTFMAQNISVWNGQGAAYIVETDSQQIIAPRATATLSLAQILAQWSFVTTLRIQRAGLDWTVYVGVPDIYGDMYFKIGVASGISTAVLVVLCVLSAVIAHFWISKPLQEQRKTDPQLVYTPFSDLK